MRAVVWQQQFEPLGLHLYLTITRIVKYLLQVLCLASKRFILTVLLFKLALVLLLHTKTGKIDSCYLTLHFFTRSKYMGICLFKFYILQKSKFKYVSYNCQFKKI